MSDFHIARNGQQYGPYSEAVVKAGLSRKRILPTDLCWTAGMTEWQPVSAVFQSAVAPPPMPAAPPLQKTSPAPANVSAFHIARNGRQYGPYSEAVIKANLSSQRILPTDLCWTAGMAEWQPVSAVFQSTVAPRPMPAAPSLPETLPAPSGAPAIANALNQDNAPRNPGTSTDWNQLVDRASNAFQQVRESPVSKALLDLLGQDEGDEEEGEEGEEGEDEGDED
jgi:hypothetical protein